MPTFPVDLDPEQLVRWIKAERKIAPDAFRIASRRGTEAKEIPVRKETHLGDEEREDLSEIVTLATLEIAPVHARDGWLLTVVVEDEAGPRIPESGTPAEAEQEIDLETFYREFIRSGRGAATIVAEVDDGEAEARMAALIETIAKDRHSPHQGRKEH
jgi:hypothetical protein